MDTNACVSLLAGLAHYRVLPNRRKKQQLSTKFVCKHQALAECFAEPVHPWVAAELPGIVLGAHCTCMVGLGEACSHVAAVQCCFD